MFNIIQSLGSLPKAKDVKIDGIIFQLHYMFTVVIHLSFFLIITSRQFSGDPIDCSYDKDKLPKELFNSYCWTFGTYIIPDLFESFEGSTPHPGVGPPPDDEGAKHYLTYYQWVYLALFLGAISFYAPRWVWLQCEGGKVETLTKDLVVGMLKEEETMDKMEAVVEYLTDTWKMHNCYAGQYILCEIYAFFNSALHIFILDLFFQGWYRDLGVEVVKYHQNKIGIDPLVKVFPRVTMCHFEMYGATSGVERINGLCVLPLNIVNEKIYIFVWFWVIILSVLTALATIIHVVVLSLPSLRYYVIRNAFFEIDKENFRLLIRKGTFGDFFLLYLLGRNVDNVVFKMLISELVKKFRDKIKEV